MTRFIQPIGPIRPISPERLMEFNSEDFVTTMLRLICIFLFYLTIHKITKLIVSKTPGFQKESKKIPIYHCISIILVSSLLIAFGWSTELIKGIIFMQILLYASISDIQTHEVKDFVSVLIFVTGFIGVISSEIPKMILSGLIIGGMLLICAAISRNRLGGADVKLSAACSVLLGFSRSIAGLIIGLFLAIICNIYFNHKSKTKGKAFPLVPYLSIGFMLMYFC